jgi:glycosyltransferase involved in cell wall biosynthesis
VIVVDNNSTDRSLEIARQFPFVTVIHEPRQGRGFAYNAGFDAAQSEILGRINGDSVLYPDWVAKVKAAFEDDHELRGVTGLGVTDTLPNTGFLMTTVWSRGYYLWYMADFRLQTFWGACMAVERQAWLVVRHDICTDDSVVHDDQDLGYLFAGQGFKVRLHGGLRIRTHGQHYSRWPKLRDYMYRQHTTKQRHEQLGTLQQSHARILPWWTTYMILSWGFVPLSVFLAGSFLRSVPELYRIHRVHEKLLRAIGWDEVAG